MQRATNSIVINNKHVLLFKKPRRGWYAIRGGKIEQGESLKEAVIREYLEETELHLQQPELAGAFTFTIYKKDVIVQEWMMFTFIFNKYEGRLTMDCKEGELEWIPLEGIKDIPMAKGDRKIFAYVLSSNAMLYGAFSYTEDYELIERV